MGAESNGNANPKSVGDDGGPQAGQKLSLSTTEAIAKLVLPASLLLYACGFLVAAPHFARVGVPVHIVSSHVFISAGILFVLVTGFAVIAAEFRPLVHVKNRFGMAALWLAQGLTVYAGVAIVLMVADIRAFVYVPTVAVSYLCVQKGVSRILGWPTGLVFRISEIGAVAVLWIGMFSYWVYPDTGVEVGGGRPTYLFQMSPTTDNVPSEQRWAYGRCGYKDPKFASLTGCRQVFVIYDDGTTLYVGFNELSIACDEDRRPTWPLFDDATCFQRVPHSLIGRLEIPSFERPTL